MPASSHNAERERRRAERERQAQAREARRNYLTGREEAVRQDNERLEARVVELTGILKFGLRRRPAVSYEKALASRPIDVRSFPTPAKRPLWSDFAPPKRSKWRKVLGLTKGHDTKVESARRDFEAALREHEKSENARSLSIAQIQLKHERSERARRERALRRKRLWEDGDKREVESCLKKVLMTQRLPKNLPVEVDVAYDPYSRTCVIKRFFPSQSAVPRELSFTFVKSKDEVRRSERSPRELNALYRSIIAQIALLDIRDVLTSDSRLSAVSFNGHVRVTDPRTGQQIEPCLLSVSVDRPQIESLELAAVDAGACLKHLNALVSPHPLDLEPVTPILDFHRAKYAFVEGMDAAAGLDARPVLTDLTPTEFEHLVRQLCEAMGLQSWTTRQSGDDGVDAVVFNSDPLLGGECVVQAKRYRREIGPQHIRELIGAMDGKRAGRGILITTSWFTPGALRVSRENNRISCINGAELVTLIKQHLGREVLAGTVPPQKRNP